MDGDSVRLIHLDSPRANERLHMVAFLGAVGVEGGSGDISRFTTMQVSASRWECKRERQGGKRRGVSYADGAAVVWFLMPLGAFFVVAITEAETGEVVKDRCC